MKSPWKLLTQLTARKRPTEREDDPATLDVKNEPHDREALQSSTDHDTTVSSKLHHGEEPAVGSLDPATTNEPQSEVVDDPAEPPVHAQKDEQQASGGGGELIGDGGSESIVESRLLTSDAGTAKTPAPQPERPDRLLKKRDDAVAQSIAQPKGNQGPPPASSLTTVVDDAAQLDQEINQLRILLAQKLRLQNAQLKKLLERYD